MARIKILPYLLFDYSKETEIKNGVIEIEINLEEYNKKLNIQKNKLDNSEKTKNILYEVDPFRKKIKTIRDKSNVQCCTKAFLKLYEILIKLNIKEKFKKQIKIFFNAEFPGAFICAFNHYCKINNLKYDWRASSLLKKEDGIFDDEFNLYKNYPENWIMTDKCRGDCSKIKDVLFISKHIIRNFKKVDVYTCDLGFDVGENYNEQETLHLKAHTGSLITSLLVLRKGGIAINKMYTLFKELTRYILYLYSTCFENFCIMKPSSSAAANSEVYIIGINFRGNKSNIKLLYNLFKNWNNLDYNTEIKNDEKNREHFDKWLKQCIKELANRQTQVLRIINQCIIKYNFQHITQLRKELNGSLYIPPIQEEMKLNT